MAVIYTSSQAAGSASGRKVTKLSNGWLIAIVSEGLASNRVMKSTDNGNTWTVLTQLYYPSASRYASSSSSIVSTGTTVIVLATVDNPQTSSGYLICFRFDATTVGATANGVAYINGPARAIDMVYDASTNTLHAVTAHYQGVNGNYVAFYLWSGDLGTTWTSVTLVQTSGQTVEEVAITVNASGQPIVAYQNSMTAHLFLGKGTVQRPTTLAQLGIVDMNQFGYAPNPQGPYNAMSLVKNPTNGYLFFVTAGGGNGYITAMRSGNGGVSWETKYTFGTQSFNMQDVQATIDNQGRVVAIYSTKNSSTTSTSEVFIATSAVNDVSSWSAPTLLDSGNISTTLVNSPSMSHDPNTLASTYYYMWRKNASGTYTDQARTSNTQPNAPVITYPAANSWINTRTPVVTWNFSDPDAGDYQSQYWIQLVDSAYSFVMKDTGWLNGNVRSWQMPADWITSDGTYYLRMMVRDSAGANSGPGIGTPGDTTFYNVYFGVDTAIPVITSVSAQQYITGNAARVWAYGVVDNVAVQYISVYAVRPDSSYYLLGNMTRNGSTNDYYFDVTDINIDGNWHYDFRAYDAAGNVSWIGQPFVFRDTVKPTAPTQTNGIPYAISNGVSWSAFSDGANSSGLLLTTLTLQKWNGSTWVTESGFPKSVAGLTYSFTGLTPGTQYRWGVTYTDNSGNTGVLNYTTFTTNSYAVTTQTNLVSAGYIFNRRPKFRFTPTDANDSTLTDFQIQVSTVSNFSSTILDTKASTVVSGWSGWSGTSVASGGAVSYIPQTDLPLGTLYVQIRAYDGKDWGTWSTAVSISIQAVSWTTTIAADDTAISKRTIDEIRTNVNAVRQARGLASVVWTDSVITDWNGVTPTNVRAAHLIELRQAIRDIYTALIVTAPTWSTDSIIDTTVNRKGQHWIDLRNAIVVA